MAGTRTEFLLLGVDTNASNSSREVRLACRLDPEGTLILWGTAENTKNIDAVLEAGFPCLIVCDWEDPPRWAQEAGQRAWVSETASLRVIQRIP